MSTKKNGQKTTAVTRESMRSAAEVVIHGILTGKREMDSTGQVAMKTLNALDRQEQMQLSRDRMKFGMVRMLASEQELRRYIQTTQPEIKRAITDR